jgi:Zn-dependent protease
MFRSWRLGKLFDIPIYIHPTFLLVPAIAMLRSGGDLVQGLVTACLVVTVFACVLMHEYGHALMARYFGIGTADITLYLIGGVARLTKMGNSPKQELLIALAGPAVNLVLVVLLAPFAWLAANSGILNGPPLGSGSPLPFTALLQWFVFLLCFSNGGLLVFNLLPIFPMDGGRVLRALLSMGLGQLLATEIAATIGLVMAGLLALAGLFLNPMLILLAAFVAFAGQQELFAMRQRARATAPTPVVEPTDVVAEQDHYTDEAPPFRPSYHPQEPGFSGFTWDREYRVWVKWVDGRPVSTLGPTR